MFSLDPNKIMYCHLGAQKTGSSWLYRSVVTQHPDCIRGALKEYHYFSSMDYHFRHDDAPSLAKARAHADWRVTERVYSWRFPKPFVRGLNRLGIISYKTALRGFNRGKFYADFTPNYASVSPEIFDELKRFHPRMRFSFVMRDPVERLWSSIYHNIKHHSKNGVKLSQENIEKIGNRACEREFLMKLSEYERALECLADIPADHKRVFFYEEFFEMSQINQIWTMLEVEPIGKIDFSPIHVSDKKKQDMPLEWRRWAATRLAPTYYKVEQAMGRALPKPWQESLKLADQSLPVDINWADYKRETKAVNVFV